MDDFQLRLIRALERLAGREGGVVGGGPVGAAPATLVDRLGDLGGRLDLLIERLDALNAVMEEIRDGMPGGGPPGGPP